MKKSYNYNKIIYMKTIIITMFIKFRRYTTLNMKDIMKFSQTVGRMHNYRVSC